MIVSDGTSLLRAESKSIKGGVKACVERFAAHPACFAFMTGDEPTGRQFPQAKRAGQKISRDKGVLFGKSEIEKEKLDLLSKRRVLDAGMVPNGNPEDPAKKVEDFLLAKMDFTDHRIDRDVIGQFVGTIVPVTETCFNWYMKFDLADKSDDMKKLVWEFTILKFTQSRTPKYWISVVEVGQILPTG